MGKFQTLQRFLANPGLLCGPFTLCTCAPELAPLMDISFSSQAVPGARCKTLDQHRWQNHGHHREGAEASPPLRAGCSADPYLHAHEEGRQACAEDAQRPGKILGGGKGGGVDTDTALSIP